MYIFHIENIIPIHIHLWLEVVAVIKIKNNAMGILPKNKNGDEFNLGTASNN